jgi:hypothetical protein
LEGSKGGRLVLLLGIVLFVDGSFVCWAYNVDGKIISETAKAMMEVHVE